MVSCHQIAKQKLNALWIFFAKLGGLRSCRAGLVSLKSSPRFRSRLPISDDQASFGGEGGGNEGLPVSRPSLPTGRRAELCLGRAEVPLSSQSSWRRQRRTAAWSGCRWRVSVCVPNRIFVFFSFFFFFFLFCRYFCYCCCCCCCFVAKCRLDFCFLCSDAARSERGRERYTNPMPF